MPFRFLLILIATALASAVAQQKGPDQEAVERLQAKEYN